MNCGHFTHLKVVLRTPISNLFRYLIIQHLGLCLDWLLIYWQKPNTKIALCLQAYHWEAYDRMRTPQLGVKQLWVGGEMTLSWGWNNFELGVKWLWVGGEMTLSLGEMTLSLGVNNFELGVKRLWVWGWNDFKMGVKQPDILLKI